MKEKIAQLSKGIFEYELPGIILSEERIVRTVEAGKRFHGSFTVANTEHSFIKGLIYSDSKHVELKQHDFAGEESVIEYEIRAEYADAGEVLKGTISIISSCGEQGIPFEITVELPFCMTSIGKIKDLFHFANLAKEDWVEAGKLFKNKQFKQVFLYNDRQNRILYKELIKSISTSHAMEEFLVAIHKKLPIHISADKTSVLYDVNGTEKFMDKIILTKDQWGYEEINIKSSMPFLIPEHKKVWSDNFIGSIYRLEYVIDPSHMKQGKNCAELTLETVYQTITVKIQCNFNQEREEKEKRKQKKVLEYKLINNYLEFRMGHLDMEQYVSDSEAVLVLLENMESGSYCRLMRAQLFIISGKMSQAEEILNRFEEDGKQLKEESFIYYCAFLYLKALFSKDDRTIQKSVKEIEHYYESENHDWRLLWYLMYLDSKYDKNRNMKLDVMHTAVEEGCNSPVIYYEICSLYNKDPSLLHALGDMNIRALNWGIQNAFLTKEVIYQFTYLASKEKQYRPVLFYALRQLYRMDASDDILMALCGLLIRGNKTASRYFYWYQTGVKRQLRLTQLYEYYMYSLDEEQHIELDPTILMYFAYNSKLSDDRKSYLYAQIIKDKEQSPSVYQNYRKNIEQFAIEQITRHNIDQNLAIIYEEILNRDIITENLAIDLSEIMFRNLIICNNPHMKGVYVVHKELTGASYVPFSGGKAQIDIFTDNAKIILKDYSDNLYSDTVEYTLYPLMKADEYVDRCYSLYPSDQKVLLYLSEKVDTYQKYDERSIEIRRKTNEIKGLRKNFCRDSMQTLIQYYYDNFEGELLEQYLLKIDLGNMHNQERVKVIEYMIIRDLYEEAMQAIQEFGYEEISLNRLIKLCSRVIMRDGTEKENSFLTDVSYYVFSSGKYDDMILRYLILYFLGTTEEMYQLWKAASSFELNTVVLEERLLGQMLFAESYLSDSYEVFLSYYKNGCNKKLTRAFLSYNAYRYFVHNRIIHPELFEIMKKELIYEENEVCKMALLKYYSTKDTLTDDERQMSKREIDSLIEKGKIFPFFRDFKDQIEMPSQIIDRCYVEYTANPKKKVLIHYMNSDDDSRFVEEEMQDLYLGVRVSSFILFYNEEIQYYITEREEQSESITESLSMHMEEGLAEERQSRHHSVNLMLMAQEMQDETTLLALMDQYACSSALIEELFQPL